MSDRISPQAAAAREHARRATGEFGVQTHTPPDFTGAPAGFPVGDGATYDSREQVEWAAEHGKHLIVRLDEGEAVLDGRELLTLHRSLEPGERFEVRGVVHEDGAVDRFGSSATSAQAALRDLIADDPDEGVSVERFASIDDVRDLVRHSLGEHADSFDVDAIAADIADYDPAERDGVQRLDRAGFRITVDEGEFWEIAARHDLDREGGDPA